MTLGWLWLSVAYHYVQLALVLKAYLTRLTQESSSLPSDHTCSFAVSVTLPALILGLSGRTRSCESF